MKKICIITRSLAGGGAERVAINLASHFANLGHPTTLIAISSEGAYKKQIRNNFDFVDLKSSNTRSSIFKLYYELRKRRPDFVLSVILRSNIATGLVFYLSKKYCKVIMREANTFDEIYQLSPLRSFVRKFLMKLTYLKADKIIANSEQTKQDLVDNRIVNEKKISVIGNPVIPDNVLDLSNQSIEHEWFKSSAIKVILTIGRLHLQKDQETLIKAFALAHKEVDKLRLVIIGEGERKTNLIKTAKELNVFDKIEIMNFQDNPYPFYKRSDLFVLTSKWEGFGNVLVEAMACGTPIICTNCRGGPKEILKNGDLGKLVPVGDFQKLSREIVSHFNSKTNANEKEKLILEAKNYEVSKIAKIYIDI
jgi:glycosyltransferase involved in cell wall biosynthesis